MQALGNVPHREALVYVAAANDIFGVHGSRFRYAFVTLAADQLLTNSPSRSRASGNLSIIAANPRRKCEGASQQSPGASRMPCSAAAWQKARLFSPLTSHGKAVSPPRGGIQPSVSRCSDMKEASCRRF